MSYPINLDVEGKVCIVIGGGHVAYRKVNGLINAKAKIILIAPNICDELKQLINDNKIEWRQDTYSNGCLPEGLLLIAATNDVKVNEMAAVEATNKHMLVNIVNKIDDNVYNNNFTIPSIIRRGKLTLTISTEGNSPALSKMIRLYLENQINDNFAKWLERLLKIRDEVKIKIKDANERESFWRNVMSNREITLVQNGELDKAEVNIRNALDCYRNKS